MKISSTLLHAACIVAITGTLSNTWAADSIPNSAQPGRVEQEFKTLRVPKSNAKAFVPGQRDLVAPAGADKTIFRLNQLQFEGVTAFDTADLVNEFKEFTERDISLVDLYAIANRVTVYYRNKGYVLSQAVVPEQEIDDRGIATIQVIEGYINKITVNGISEKKQQRILKVTDRIRQSRPLSARDLERYLLILNDFGGVNFSATLSPSDEVGAADILLNVSKTKVNASVTLENRGTDIIGPERLTGQFTVNDLLGRFDSNDLTVISTGNSELSYLSIKNETPVGRSGWRFSNALSASNSKPGGELEILEIENDSTTFTTGAEYPLIRSRVRNLSIRGELDIYNSESIRLASAEGSESLATKDKIRSLRLGLVFDNIDQYRGVNLIDIELSQGLGILSASELGDSGLSRELGDPEYTKLHFYAARLQSIVPNFSALLALNAQYSNDNLLSSEQFGIGGKNFGAAFDSSEIIGDSGIAGRIELRYSRSLQKSIVKSIVGYTFIDGGEIKRNAPSLGQQDKESLSSYGIGLRYRLGEHLAGYLEYALPNNRDVASEGNDDGRFFFSLKSSL
ncbi:MAG: ShlB/FhaC/HecB family hemolysin secretion/activation protein [Arenicella sp.]